MGRPRSPLPPELWQLSLRMRAFAATRGGVLSAVHCHELGVDKAAVRRLLAGGHWLALRRGIYGDPGFVLHAAGDGEYHRRCAALLAGLGAPGVVSHGSAARLLRLPLPSGDTGDRISLTRRPPAPTNDPLGGDVYVGGFDDADVVDVGGVPVLAGARLVLDCCAVMTPECALAVADAALRRTLTTKDDLRREAARRRGRPGNRTAARVAARADRGGHSWFESVSRWWLLEAGLPVPQLQTCFTDSRGAVRACVDLWFPGQRTVGEADGAGKYDQPGALFAEKRREDWLRDVHRVEVVRWVPAEMRTPGARAEVVARFHRAFARRS